MSRRERAMVFAHAAIRAADSGHMEWAKQHMAAFDRLYFSESENPALDEILSEY